MNSSDRIRTARTFLFVPGDRPDRFAKAVSSSADVVVLDLEDAVADEAKEGARASVAAWLSEGGHGVVRVNAHGTRWHEEDVAAVVGLADAVMVPKAEHPGEWADTDGCPVIALVDTARGVLGADATLGHPDVIRAAFGSIDLAAEIGVDPDDRPALAFARSQLVLASAANRLAGPVDGVTTALHDESALTGDVVAALRIGMTAKLCIHPAQVGLVHDCIRPGDEDVAWATRVLAVTGSGVLAVDGHMVDVPVLTRARRLLERAGVDPHHLTHDHETEGPT